MTGENPQDVAFDRVTGKFKVPSFFSHVHVRSLQLSSRALAPFGYFGISRVHSLLGKIFNAHSDTRVSEHAFSFTYPSNDYYWNRLLDVKWQYEPEIDIFLRAIAKVPFAFLDLGANFGYWSAHVGAGVYGKHLCVAVEPSTSAYEYLERNSVGLPNEVRTRRFAIDEISGKKIVLYGNRHAGRSIDENWAGASRMTSNEVESVSIDQLVKNESIELKSTPLIVKLDVEGAELRAIKGAAAVIAADSIFIVEDAERNDLSEAISVLHAELGCTVYVYQNHAFKRFSTREEIVAYKREMQSLQVVGLNMFVTKSPFWKNTLDALSV